MQPLRPRPAEWGRGGESKGKPEERQEKQEKGERKEEPQKDKENMASSKRMRASPSGTPLNNIQNYSTGNLSWQTLQYPIKLVKQ